MTKTAYTSSQFYGYRARSWNINVDHLTTIWYIPGQTYQGLPDDLFISNGPIDGTTYSLDPYAVPTHGGSYTTTELPDVGRQDNESTAVVQIVQAGAAAVADYGTGMLTEIPVGGDAESIINIDDTATALAGQSLGVNATAFGGNGVYENYYASQYPLLVVAPPSNGPAGRATASATLRGTNYVSALAQAFTAAGTSGREITAHGVDGVVLSYHPDVATATSYAAGPHARSTAIASGYSGGEFSGFSVARAGAEGTDGAASGDFSWDGTGPAFPSSGQPITAHAATAVGLPYVISAASALVSAPVNGTSNTEAAAQVEGDFTDWPPPSGLQGLAYILAYPDYIARDVFFTAADQYVENALASGRILAMERLGVATPVGAAEREDTTTSSTSFTMGLQYLTDADKDDHLVVGFAPLTASENFADTTGYAEFKVTANSTVVLDQFFTSAAAAQAYFTDHVIDLGVLSTLATASSAATNDQWIGENTDAITPFLNNLTVTASLILDTSGTAAFETGVVFSLLGQVDAGNGPTLTINPPYPYSASTTVFLSGSSDVSEPVGAAVDIYDNNVLVGSGSITSNPHTWVGNATLAEGQHNLTAKLAGGPSSAAVPVTVDTTPPTVGFDAGPLSLFGGQITLTGTVSDSVGIADVFLLDGFSFLGYATVSGNTWSYTTSFSPNVTHTIAVWADDLAYNQGIGPVSKDFTIVNGHLEDGPIEGATVFQDNNGNGMADPGEPSFVTDANGFTHGFLNGSDSGHMVASGGTDTWTGLPFVGAISAPSGSNAITPLTTLIDRLMIATADDPTPLDSYSASQVIIAGLGLPLYYDFLSYDPVVDAQAGSPDAIAVLEAGARVQDMMALAETAGGSSDIVLDHIVQAVLAAKDTAQPDIHLTDAETISDIVMQPGIDMARADAIGLVISATASAVDGWIATQSPVPSGADLRIHVGGAGIALRDDAAHLFAEQTTDQGYTDAANSFVANLPATLDAGDMRAAELATACFLPNTRILTECGEVAVERLAVGDRVRTLQGELRRIVWIGTGQVLATRGRRTAATPVIVRKGALADNVPNRDLRITKGHALYMDGALIPVEFLVNHRSIIWDDHAQEVTIYHIELDRHDVLLANGAPAESYRDDGNRWLFRNANTGWGLPQQEACAPILTGGPVVDAVWRRLVDRAEPRIAPPPLTSDPDLHLLVDGRRVDAVSRSGTAHVFPLGTVTSSVRVVSRSGSPAELGLARDPRELGVAVRRATVRQGSRFLTIEADDAQLADGFHAFEPQNGFRWTNGNAALPAALFATFRGFAELVLNVACTSEYALIGNAIQSLVA